MHLMMLALLWCLTASASEAAAPQSPANPVGGASQGVAIDPDQLKRTLMSRDSDQDGVDDYHDNCQQLPNSDQSNQDGDVYGDACDACPTEPGGQQLGCPHPVGPREQISRDEWRTRHAGSDWDQDRVEMPQDNCPLDSNPDQADADGDGWGDMCDRCRDKPSPDTVDGCTDGTRWAVDLAIAADPQGFCLGSCEVLETCHMITSRFPGETGTLVRSQCERACKTDPAMRDRLNTLGSSGTFLTTACDLEPDMQESFRLWDNFACDQLYCSKLAQRCGTQHATYPSQHACIQSCLDFGAYRPGAYGEQAEQGINCLIETVQSASGTEACAQALPKNATCPRN